MRASHEMQVGTEPPVIVLPALENPGDLQIELLREPGERLFRGLLLGSAALPFVAYVVVLFVSLEAGLVIAAYAGLFAATIWVSIKLSWGYLEGNSIQVSPQQYPQIFEAVREAASQLAVPMPKIFVMQGSGVVDILVAKHYTRRGYVILTSDLVDALIESATSRELLMLVGRQLGHIKAGHFRWWLIKDVVGVVFWIFHKAYWRRAHLTADRVGLVVAGDLYAAEQALLILTVGPKLAMHTNMEMLDEQAEMLREHFWPRFARFLSEYPHIIERISRLREFANRMHSLRSSPGTRPVIGALPIRHMRLKALPLMMVHGHDHAALHEIKDFLRTRYPYIDPVVMSLETLGSVAMPEKFERLAAKACGAIALLTPDDVAAAVREAHKRSHRARQNVVLEIGWFWGRLGRARCLLLSQGKVEMPSDLAGVECLEYIRSPREHFESIRDFISQLERLETGAEAAGGRPTPWTTATAPLSIGESIPGADCPNCHEPLVIGARFCEHCGASLAGVLSAI